jgi:hypothetical protein
MKWKKFLELQAKYPFLPNDLCWRGTLPDAKDFVRKKVGFIAFRPFEKLDLSETYSSNSTPLDTKYAHVKMAYYTTVEYQISFHIEGENEGTRTRHVDPGIGDGSIQAHIDDIMRWFDGCEVFQDKRLMWERVIKRTVSGSSYAGLTSMNLEIYQFPRYYRCKPWSFDYNIPVPNPATRAYVLGEEMPPLVPGRI